MGPNADYFTVGPQSGPYLHDVIDRGHLDNIQLFSQLFILPKDAQISAQYAMFNIVLVPILFVYILL